MRKYIAVVLLILLAIGYSYYPGGGQSATTITLPNGSSYSIECTLAGFTLSCHIEKLSGQDLSHWVLDLGACNEAVLSTDPQASYTNNDSTTGATGWKFEPITSQSFTYTLTLDKLYGQGEITATMKAGAPGNYASGLVVGPDCVEVIPTETPTTTPTPAATDTPTDTPTATNTPTPMPTNTPTPTETGDVPMLPTVSDTPTATPTATDTLEPTGTPTASATPTMTPTPTETATDVPTPTVTVVVDGPTNEIEIGEPSKERSYFLPLLHH